MIQNSSECFNTLNSILVTYLDSSDIDLINKYYEKSLYLYDGMKRLTGEDYICHALRVAILLSGLKMDAITIGCALIHEAMLLDKMTNEEIINEFGKDSASIIECITKISLLNRTFSKAKNLERYRKIIVGLSEEPRALFIKLADRLDNLNTIYVHSKEHQDDIIKETKDVFIPIAHRLGIKKFKSEMEDLCLKFSLPNEYEEVLNLISASRSQLEKDIHDMKDELIDMLNEHSIKFDITCRVKSVYGVYVKLALGRKFNDIYDLLGLRIIVDKIEECYLILGLIHAKYKSIPKRFKDFIANPKSNMYQSLHTTVIGPNDRMYEVQIRTHDMDKIAESGVASHWSYKEHTSSDKSALDTRLESFKTLININDETNNIDFFKNLDSELNKEEIYIFTPKGDAIELPVGASIVDFAYRIHTEVGDTLVGAMVNDKMVKLDYSLQDGDVVNLLTEKGRHPNKAWLRFVKTPLAKSRIKSYFSKMENDKIYALGKEILDRQLRKEKLKFSEVFTEEKLNTLFKELSIKNLDELYFSLYNLKYTGSEVIRKVLKDETSNNIKLTNYKDTKSKEIIIGDKNDDILCSFAKCCKPVYGEDVIGYITKGEGIRIHRRTCHNVNDESDRLINVKWKDENNNKYSTNISIVSLSNDILASLTVLSAKYDVNIYSFNVTKFKKDYLIELSIKVKNKERLNDFLNELDSMKDIISAKRKSEL